MNDGGAAFPEVKTKVKFEDVNAKDGSCRQITTAVPYVYSEGGMSLRDWFAGQALTGIIAQMNAEGVKSIWHKYHEDPDLILNKVAEAAYVTADAMLKRRATNT